MTMKPMKRKIQNVYTTSVAFTTFPTVEIIILDLRHALPRPGLASER
jgi:hypothetical protein